MGGNESVAIVAILKHEGEFVEEWIAYHRLLGVDHFVLYDNDTRQTLRTLLAPYCDYVKVVDWADGGMNLQGRNPQTRAYKHALSETHCAWIAFIDVDEFIVLRKNGTLGEFLVNFRDAEAVLLSWHVFGHNGYFDNPPGLISELLVRRRLRPGGQVKSIVRREAIKDIPSAHYCQLRNPLLAFDANHCLYSSKEYPGKTDVAHINHYYCRSFSNWMARVSRGQVAYPGPPFREEDKWKHDHEACLRQFVIVSKDFNEYVDAYLTCYAQKIKAFLEAAKQVPSAAGRI